MGRVIKKATLPDGSTIDVYSENCIVCQTEMVFPKQKADEFEELLPFLKEKIEAGTPCVGCSKKLMEEGKLNLFSKEEIEKINEIFLDSLKKKVEEEKARKEAESQITE